MPPQKTTPIFLTTNNNIQETFYVQLSVIKNDGSIEQYLHTKVLGTINRALDDVEQTNIIAAEQFAEAVTFHLYHNSDSSNIKSEDVHHLVIKALTETGYQQAAIALGDHRKHRKITRSRIEVLHSTGRINRWNKSLIVRKLTGKCQLEQPLARAVATSVEEKVLNLNMTRVNHNLVGLLVVAETEIMLKAEKELALVAV